MTAGSSRKRQLRTGIAVGLAAIVAGALYLLMRAGPPAPALPTEKLRLAIPMVPHAALLHIASANGYFSEEGLEVELIPAIHGKASIELVLLGKADLGAGSEVAFVLAVMKREPLAIAAAVMSSSNDVAVIGRRDRGIAAPRDLVGKKVGVTLGTAAEYFLWAFLIRNKLSPRSVTPLDVPAGEIANALAAGSLDAVSTWQPIVADAQLALAGNGVTFFEPLAYMETVSIIGRRDFMTGRPKAIEKLVRALLKAERFSLAHAEEAIGVVARQLKVEVTSLRPLWKQFNFRVDLQQPQLNTMEDAARWAVARGYAPDGPAPNFLSHLYLDALLTVQPQRVSVLR